MPSYKKTAEYDKLLHQLSKIMIFLSFSTGLAAVYILIALHYKLPHWTMVLADVVYGVIWFKSLIGVMHIYIKS